MSPIASTGRLLALLLTMLTVAPAAARVAPSVDQVRPLMIGQVAPDATVVGVDGKSRSLRALLSKKQAVVVFFRGGWCPYCNKQLQQLQNILGALGQANYQVIAISPDPPEKLRGFQSEKGLKFQVYSDPGSAAAKKFGLAYQVGPKDFGGQGMFKSWQAIDGKRRDAEPILPVPAVYLTLPSKIIVYQYVNIDIAVRLSAEVLLTAARAYGSAS